MNATKYLPINFSEKFTQFSEYWTPKILAQFDGYSIKAAKMKGEFIWHSHADGDEVFIVISGVLKILLRDGEVLIKSGECFVVPKGAEHKPIADEEVWCLLIEKTGILNTGDHNGDKTITHEQWI